MDKHRLIVDSVVVRFGRKTVLSGGYITSETGIVTGLLGRNGAGKSCMFRALMGGLRVENVMVSIDGKPMDRRIIGHGIIVTNHNHDAISSVADHLFVIADGYTSPVRCREDLVRHGYLSPENPKKSKADAMKLFESELSK